MSTDRSDCLLHARTVCYRTPSVTAGGKCGLGICVRVDHGRHHISSTAPSRSHSWDGFIIEYITFNIASDCAARVTVLYWILGCLFYYSFSEMN